LTGVKLLWHYQIANDSKGLREVTNMKRVMIATGALLLSAVGFQVFGQAPALPGTSVDRVGFPMGYRDTFKQLFAFDNNQGRSIRVIWGNDAALGVSPAEPYDFPYGSIMIFEDYPAITDANGEPVRDENGRFVKGDLRTVFVMRKERGFGAEYKEIRNGEWEYVSYNPDGSYATAPAASGACALCHMQGSSLPLSTGLTPANSRNDYVFRANYIANGGSGAIPDGVTHNYLFVPKTIHVQPGSTVTIYNTDDIVHNVVADDGSFQSAYLAPGGSYSIKVGDSGEIPVHCALHNRMKGKIVIDPPAVPASVFDSPHR
jgi:plastocyanin